MFRVLPVALKEVLLLQGLAIHFGKVHEVLRGRKLHDEAVDGRQGPLAGQRVYREVLAHAQVRGRLSEGLHGHEGML